MQQREVINQIEKNGVTYVFQDSECQTAVNNLTVLVNGTRDDLEEAIETERLRALEAESNLSSTKVDKVTGKGLSTNDLTDALLDKINNPLSYSQMVGASETADGKSGFVPKPLKADRTKYLDGSGVWSVPTDTTYSKATSTSDGLMSKEDKLKLDTVQTHSYDEEAMTTVFDGNTITSIYGNPEGRRVVTTLQPNSIKQVVTEGESTTTLVTTFNADGSVSRVRS